MSQTCFSVRKLTPSIGGEIDGVDIAALSDHDLRDVRQALLDHLIIFFRNQKLTLQQQKEIGLHFGPLHIHPAPLGVVEGHPEIIVIKADENSKRIAGDQWHSDVSCDVRPPMGTQLYLTEVPPTGGDTLFASMYAAHDALSGSMQRFLSGLTAIHDGARGTTKADSLIPTAARSFLPRRRFAAPCV